MQSYLGRARELARAGPGAAVLLAAAVALALLAAGELALEKTVALEQADPRLKRMVGDKVLGEVLDLYFECMPKRITALRDGLRLGDLEAAARALHDMKSSAGMVGACGVQDLAQEMERLAREGDAPALDARLGRLETALADADEAVRQAKERRQE